MLLGALRIKIKKDFPIVKLFIGWTMLPAKTLISMFPYKWPRQAMAKQALSTCKISAIS